MLRCAALIALTILSFASTCQSAAPYVSVDRYRCPRPGQFAFVFSAGYAGDHLPKDDSGFEKLLESIKKGGFTVVHCTFSESRLKLCKKHRIAMMVDLLAPEHHVYKKPDQAKQLCERLRGEEAVWGYNIWNDPVGKQGAGRTRDTRNVRTWDPTHPAFCGLYRTSGLRHLHNADVIGYYDFHWKRGIDQHFGHLITYSEMARQHNSSFLTWLSATSGQAGKGNYNRNLYSTNTSLAFGAKGIIWFLGTDLLDLKSMTWKEAGKDILKVQQQTAPAARFLHPLGLPEAVFTTKATKTPNNTALPGEQKDRFPPGLEKRPLPERSWLTVSAGEVLLGVFRDSKNQPVVYIVNHNAYDEQTVKLKGTGYSRPALQVGQGNWQRLNEGEIELKLTPGGGQLLWFEK